MCESATRHSPLATDRTRPSVFGSCLPVSGPPLVSVSPNRHLRIPANLMEERTLHLSDASRSARRRFPGLPSQISHARRFVARQLTTSPELTTATLLTSELATNAIRHSASGLATGKFEVSVHTAPGWARIEVRDLGNRKEAPQPQHRNPYDTAEHGRGLDLVEALSSKWGSEPRKDGMGREVWFELAWGHDDDPE